MIQHEATVTIDSEVFERLRIDVGVEDTAFLHELIDEYLTNAAALIGELKDAARAEDADALEWAAHTLKGSSAHVGALTLRDHCTEIERCAARGAFEEAERHITAANAEFERVEQVLEQRQAEL